MSEEKPRREAWITGFSRQTTEEGQSALHGRIREAAARAREQGDGEPLLELLRQMPLTSARCLKAANSPFLDHDGGVHSLSGALQVLGSGAMAMITLATSFDHGGGLRWSERMEVARRHSCRTAVLAQQIALVAGRPDQAEAAYMAGLLHDIASLRENAREDTQAAFPSPLLALHEASAARSAKLLRSWHLPSELVSAIAVLGEGVPAAPDSLGTVLSVAHRLADRIGETPLPARELTTLSAWLGLGSAALERALHETGEQLRQAGLTA